LAALPHVQPPTDRASTALPVLSDRRALVDERQRTRPRLCVRRKYLSRPEEAAQALTENRQRQQQVIDLVVLPTWYWWAIAAQIRKGFVGKRPRTSARLTASGRTAFDQHVAALQEIVSHSGATILPR
jgi:hypothetical protein